MIQPVRPAIERVMSPEQCYWCGQSPRLPDQLIPVSRHEWTQSIVLALRTPCCHQACSTEPFGTVIDYLCDGWKRAELICRLYNESVGAPVEPSRDRPPSFIAPTDRARG